MNKSYILSGDTFLVSTNKGIKKADKIDNIEEILITENNIEEIEELKKNNNECISNFYNVFNFLMSKTYKNILKISITLTILITLIATLSINISILLPSLLACLCITGCSLLTAIPIVSKKSNKLLNKIKKQKNKKLDEDFNKQSENLITLTKESKELTKETNDHIIFIEKSEMIKNLRRQLKLIETYQLNKRKFVKYYKELFKLKDLGYSEKDIQFIQFLIEEDLQYENKNNKTLKLTK